MVNSVVLIGRVQGDPNYIYAPEAQNDPAWHFAPADRVEFVLSVDRPVKGLIDGDSPADFFRIELTGPAAVAFQKSNIQHGQLLGVQGRCIGVTGGCMVRIQSTNIRLLASKAA